MKKIQLIIVAAYLVVNFQQVRAQTCAGTANVSSGITTHYVPKFATSPSNCLENSQIFDDGTYVGVGNATPSYKLDVSGNINASTTSGGYRIAGNLVMHQNGSNTNIFVGNNAGTSISSGTNNSFLGSAAGTSNTSGNYNTFIGNSAGGDNSDGVQNTSVGYGALYSNISGDYNCAFGMQALSVNTVSYNNAFGYQVLYNNTTGTHNNAFGSLASYSITTGSDNNAFGHQALEVAATGSYNAAFGSQALWQNTTSYNSAFGHQALYTNSSGSGNNAIGYKALYTNGTAADNNAFGYEALYYNTGSANTAFGHAGLTDNTTGHDNTSVGYEALLLQGASSETDYNTAIGSRAGEYNTTGSNNTYVGATAGSASGNGTNSNKTFVGYGATESGDNSNVSAFGAGASNNNGINNTMMFGIAGTKLYSSGGNFSTSDGRFKTNVTENVKGLAFINKLRPVTYNLNIDALDNFMIQGMSDSAKAQHKVGQDFTSSSAEIHSGFIAQEVEQAAQQVGFTSSIVSVPVNINKSNYALNYAEIVVPLVKGMQEQQSMIDSLKQQVAQLTKLLSNNNGNINGGNTSPNSTTGINAQNIELSDADVVVLNQNQPNPFAEQTVINYTIPQSANSAQILFYDINGKQIKSQNITTKGKGALNVYANDLSNGTYSYTLIVDGKVIDTKKMVKQQ
jgi:hypothetical protein